MNLKKVPLNFKNRRTNTTGKKQSHQVVTSLVSGGAFSISISPVVRRNKVIVKDKIKGNEQIVATETTTSDMIQNRCASLNHLNKVFISNESTYENSCYFPVMFHRMLQLEVRNHPTFMMWVDNGAGFIIDYTCKNADLTNIIKTYYKRK